MKFFICFLFVSLLSINSGFAQNTVLMEHPDSIKLDRDYNVFIPKALSELTDANILLKMGLNSFVRDHLVYRGLPFIIFPAHGYHSIMNEAYRDRKAVEDDYMALFEKLKTLFFQNKSFYENLYKALMPLYKEAVSKMTPGETEILLYEIKKALNYAKTFNPKVEKAAENKLGPEFANYKGKLSAFVYRRIINNELSKNECIFWLNRIYEDLASAVKKSGRKEDEYILEGKTQMPGAYTAVKPYDSEDDYQIIIHKENKYNLLLPENAVIISDMMQLYNAIDLSHIIVAYPGGKNELVIFHADTLNYKSPDYITLKNTECYPNIRTNFIYLICDYSDSELYVFETNNQAKKSLKKIELKKKVKDLFNAENFVCILYEDGTSEIMYPIIEQDSQQLKSYYPDSEINYFYESSKGEYAILNFKNKHSLLLSLINNKIETISFPQDLEGYELGIWRNYFLTHLNSTDRSDLDCKIISKNGEILNSGIDYLISSDSINFLAAYKNGFFTLYDSALNIIASGYEPNPDAYTGKKEKGLYLSNDSKILILSKYTYIADKISDIKMTVFDRFGKQLIEEKWPFIKSLNIYEKDYENPYTYFAICDIVSINGNVIKPIGKYALFSPEGKQLTDFKYDSIFESNLMPGHFECIINKDKVILDSYGKEVN